MTVGLTDGGVERPAAFGNLRQCPVVEANALAVCL
jgi:hypothetical protein